MENIMGNIINYLSVKTGDGFLYSGHSVLAKEVQKFQCKCYPEYAAKFNHAGVFVWLKNQLMVCEAVINGIQLTNFKHYTSEKLDHHEDILMCLKPTFQIVSDEIIDLCLKMSGTTHYDFVNLGFFQLVRMISKNKIWLGGKKVDDKYICGEWLAHVYNFFIEFCDNEKRIAPADFILDNRLIKQEIVLI
jgi:hypothetical protein